MKKRQRRNPGVRKLLPELNNNQLFRLSEFCANLGLVFVASVVTPLFTDVDRIGISEVVLGLLGALISLSFSLFLVKGTR